MDSNIRVNYGFRAGTRVRMADGCEKPIEQVVIGDLVAGQGGASRVIGVDSMPLVGRRLYSINGGRAFITEAHPFMSATGWCAIDPEKTRSEIPRLEISPLRIGDRLLVLTGYRGVYVPDRDATARDVCLLPVFEALLVRDITATDVDALEPTYSLLLDSDDCYVADGFLVHDKSMQTLG